MNKQEKIKKGTIEYSHLVHTLEDLYDDAFEDGASWQKEQIMKDAIDWEIEGEKVKVIIIEEDEK